MASLEQAVELTKKGFYIMPLVSGQKTPITDGVYRSYATREEKILRRFWVDPLLEIERDYNIGICTDKFGDDEALVVVDVDVTEGKDGRETIKQLTAEGFKFPKTLMHKTPTGGYHLFYRAKDSVTGGAGVLGTGLDIRSYGGLVVAPGSTRWGYDGFYEAVNNHPIVHCPEWIIAKRRRSKTVAVEPSAVPLPGKHSNERAIEYLKQVEPAVKGHSGDGHTYNVACKLKVSFGLNELNAVELMLEHFYPRCTPNNKPEFIKRKVRNAFAYSQKKQGSDSPQAAFNVIEEEPCGTATKAVNPIEEQILSFNKDHIFVLDGGKAAVLWETRDHRGQLDVKQMTVDAFNQYHANNTILTDAGKVVPASRLWLTHPKRATKQAIVFDPRNHVPPAFYNLWRGFGVEPLGDDEEPTQEMRDALDAFKEHVFENVCEGIEALDKWLTTFFAHLLQKPWEKPLVAPVFCGQKGVGKDSLVNCIGNLMPKYHIIANNSHYLTSNFNSYFEKCLLAVFNEAFWSGDKKAEGKLKGLITDPKHFIEKKGYEARMMDNYMRIIIMGNEDWLVPATQDERRFAVFNIGTKRRQDNQFFRTLRLNMEAGGYRYLMKYLLEYPLDSADIDVAPSTKGLYQQKMESLSPLQKWWRSCLQSGDIEGSMDVEWPKTISISVFCDAFRKSCKDMQIRSRLPDNKTIGKELRSIVPNLGTTRQQEEGARFHVFKLPPLEECRKNWEDVMKFQEDWES